MFGWERSNGQQRYKAVCTGEGKARERNGVPVCRGGGREEGRREVEAIVHDREGKGSGKIGGSECAKVIGESEKAGRGACAGGGGERK